MALPFELSIEGLKQQEEEVMDITASYKNNEVVVGKDIVSEFSVKGPTLFCFVSFFLM